MYKILLDDILLATSLTEAALVTLIEESREIFVPVKEGKIFCRIIGKGKPLIVIHGGPGFTQDYLQPETYALAKDNMLIFYDQRGCGQSTGEVTPETITITAFVEDIEAIRQALNLDKVSLLGHSWGGLLALHYAIVHQEHVDKLVVSNAAPASSKGYALFEQQYSIRMQPYVEELKRIQSSQAFLEGDNKAIAEFYRLIIRRYCFDPVKANLLNLHMSPTAALQGLKVAAILTEHVFHKPYDLHQHLQQLKVATLILHGDADPIPVSTAQEIHKNIPHSQYVLMNRCGHFPSIEEPVNYFKYIAAFLNPS